MWKWERKEELLIVTSHCNRSREEMIDDVLVWWCDVGIFVM